MDCLPCIYSEMAAVLESSQNLPHSHVRLLPVGWNLRWTVCQSNYWWPLYVLGFSQDGIWVPKRQPGWWYISFWPKVLIMAFHLIILVETGPRAECQLQYKMVMWDGNCCCGHLCKVKSATVTFHFILIEKAGQHGLDSKGEIRSVTGKDYIDCGGED